MSLLVALVGALAVDRQRASVITAATQEAENVARVLGFLLMSDPNKLAGQAQEVVTELHEAENRDVVLVDLYQTILADANPAEIGGNYVGDRNDEVRNTITDGKVRTFVEIGPDYPGGIKQIAVSVKNKAGATVGAIILEYTPIYHELMDLTKNSLHGVMAAASGSVLIAFLIAFYMGRSISQPLQQLTAVATEFASGKTDLSRLPARKDEIGRLAAAFNDMVQKRKEIEAALQRARDELELRVAVRTGELAGSVSLLNATLESMADGILAMDLVGNVVLFNAKFVNIWNLPADVLERRSASEMREFGAAAVKDREAFFRPALDGLNVSQNERSDVVELKDGRSFERYYIPQRIGDKRVGTVINYHDITDRKRIEAQLLQSQKLETVGRLAGGIAHEFNSILTAIIGQSELILKDLPLASPFVKNATEIRQAADRAATLTRQLLAYGRKQILRPKILDLNLALGGMEPVLRHLVGKEVDVRVVPNLGLRLVKVDVGQIEQVIVNLAMNATDAMPNGGLLTLETANVTLDQEYVSRFPELKAGEYVMLAVTDTGIGMREEVKARIFEPFFSTKGVGQGAGLGLSTCYGILKQSGGHIVAYSEAGRGSTFKIYLPQIEPNAILQPARKPAADLPGGIETILLVEDDPALREMATTLLKRLGYNVLTAANGIEALSRTHQPGRGHIDLLFTDVVMPHMSGKELSDRIQFLFPQTKILFTSAFTENAIVHQGVLNEGVALLQKPFTPSALARKIREILDGTA